MCVCLVTQVSSVAQSCPTLLPHGLQHARFPCPSPTPWVYSNSYPLNWWCHPTISSCVVPFSFYLPSLQASGSFQMSQFTSDTQSIGVSASVSVLPMNIWTDFLQDGLVGSPCSPRDSQESSPTPLQLFATLWTVVHQAPLSMGLSRQECCSELPFPPPGDLPDPKIEPASPALAGRILTTEPPGNRLPVYIREYASGTTRWKRSMARVCGEGLRVSMPPQACHSSTFGFYRSLITWAQ